MTEKEMLKISVEEFSRVQDWIELSEKDSEIYKSLRKRYKDLKVILTSSGVNLTEIDRRQEEQKHEPPALLVVCCWTDNDHFPLS